MPSYSIPNNLRYSKDHEWVDVEGEVAVVGITEHAVKSLHDVVYVSLPEVGSEVKQGEVVTTVESIKAVSDVYSPLSGIITEVNKTLDTNPEKINESPYGDGWIFKLKPTNLGAEIEKLMDDKQYAIYLESLEKS
ncbi:MAG: glycine cleavage system protein GcvH [Nitrososphaeria archaeon]